MELRHIRYFLAVAEELNFTRAAAKVGIGQPPLSQQIRDLEDELGERLFRRLARGVELTPAGRAFLPEARAITALAGRAKKAVQRGARGEVGHLKIGFTGSASFRPLVSETLRLFLKKYPDVELSIEEADTTRLLNQLASEHLDAAFVRPGMNSSKTVLVQTLLEEPMVILLPERHPLAKFRQLPLAALANEKLVLFPRQAGVEWFDEIIASCRQSGFEPILGLEAPQITSVSNLVAAGLGVSLVPLSVASQIQKTGTCSVKIKGKSPVARLSLAVRADHSSVVLKNFEALVRSLKK